MALTVLEREFAKASPVATQKWVVETIDEKIAEIPAGDAPEGFAARTASAPEVEEEVVEEKTTTKKK